MRNALSSRLMILCSAAMMGAAVIMVSSDVVFAQGEAAQEVDTTGLEKLGPEWRQTNPYDSDNQRPVEIGAAAYNQNCARCHGLGAISGGIAPDLRYLPEGEEGDEIFVQRVRGGSTRDGRVLMPPFDGILSQETLWAIRTWLNTVYEE